MKYIQSSIRRHSGRDANNANPLNRVGADSGRLSTDGKDVLAYTSSPQTARVQAVALPAHRNKVARTGVSPIRERFWLVTSVIVTSLYLALLGGMLYLSTGEVNLGITARLAENGQWVVSEVVPSTIGYELNVQPGDIVLERDGKPLLGLGNGVFQRSFVGAKELVIKPSLNPSAGIIRIKSDSDAAKSPIRAWAFSLLGLIFIAVGGLVFAKASQRTAASAFYFFCIATATALAIATASILANKWLLVSMFTIMIVWAASFAIFFFKFPVRVGKIGRQHNIAITMVVAPGAAVVFAYLWAWTVRSEDYAWVQPLGYIYLVSCVVAGLASLTKSLVAERSPDIRQQLVLLLGGTAFAVGPNVVLGLLPSLLVGKPLVNVETTALGLGIMPLAFAYAITQHQLLGVRSLVRRGVVYVLTGSSVLFIFSIGAAALRASLPNGWDSSDIGLLSFALFVFLIALSFGYLQRRVEHMVDRYIYHDAYDYKEALLQFSAQLAAEQNLHVLSDQLVERTCRLMNLNCGVLLLAIQPDEKQGSNGWSGPISVYSGLDAMKMAGYGVETQDSRRPQITDQATRHSYERFDTRTRLRLPAGTDGNGGLIPYAKFGSGADWLVYGLQSELSRLGISLQQPGTNIHIIHFDEEQVQQASANNETLSGPGERYTGPLGNRRDLITATRLNPVESAESRDEQDDNKSATSIQAFLGVPLWTRSRFVGILCLGDKKTGERFSKDDLSLLSTLGSQAALAIYNAQLYETREQALLDTITALAHAIEAKDNYTINHCEKITGRAVALAESMALPRQDIENIRLGSILHDVGKIGIPDAILNKPSKLTDEEYEIIKQHAAIGARIVQSVGALKGVVPIVRHHQERYDGHGYPDGLAGESIPIGARIIGVVDTYGAMTEDRVYRRAPGHHAAVAELKRFAGKQFDPMVVDAFIRLLEDQPELAEPS